MIYGQITKDTTWTSAGGSYDLAASVYVSKPGVTLTISSGTVVNGNRKAIQGGHILANEAVFNNATLSLSDAAGVSTLGSRVIGCTFAGDNTSGIPAIEIGATTNCTIEDNSISNGYQSGISLDGATNCTVRNNTVTGGYNGIYLDGASDNKIVFNDLSGSYECIRIRSGSDGNTVCQNLANNAGMYGIWVEVSTGNLICDNTMLGGNGYGIYMGDADGNTVSGNIVDTCKQDAGSGSIQAQAATCSS